MWGEGDFPEMDQALGSGSLIGCQLGHYRIVEKIGEGGMGEVFLARDEHLGHDVALKVLPPGTSDHARHLFRKEAHALSRLNHPNIVNVIDFDTQEGLAFLVMEYVPGLALDERVRQGILEESEVVRIGVQIAEGLAAAHAQGVIHRDLKPGNLRLTHDDRLKILDFGLAQSTLRLGPLASTASVAGPADCSGTLPYMATEQLLGEPLDERTDIYAAGAVLYELCTGRPPFEQRLFTTLVDAILHKAPAPPSQIVRGISPTLEKIILRCLEKKAAQRFRSAKELAEALRTLTHVAEVTTRPATSRRMYQTVAAVLCMLLIAFVGYSRHWFSKASGYIPPQIDSLAVLPFANLSGDPQQEPTA